MIILSGRVGTDRRGGEGGRESERAREVVLNRCNFCVECVCTRVKANKRFNFIVLTSGGINT